MPAILLPYKNASSERTKGQSHLESSEIPLTEVLVPPTNRSAKISPPGSDGSNY